MIKHLPLTLTLTLLLGACANRATTATVDFQDPPSITVTREGNDARATLTAKRTTLTLAGRNVPVQTYDGHFPGPLLRFKEGERVHLTLENELDEATTLHLHGLPVDPAVDDPFKVIQPGARATYAFDLPAGSAGTYWYHTHTHGSSDRQLFAGLAGALVVDPAAPDALGGVEDHVVVLKDLPVTDENDTMLGMNGREGTAVLVNGELAPTLTLTSALVRLRFVNAGNARYYRLALKDTPLHMIAKDGHALRTPEAVTELLLAPGERADVLVQLNEPGTVALRNLPYDRGAHASGDAGTHEAHTESADGEVLMTLASTRTSKPADLPALAAKPPLVVPEGAPVRQVILEEQMSPTAFYINGRSFEMNRVDFHAREGTVEVWEIVNRTDMDHPFHLHTFAVQVLSRNGKPVAAEWKDVVNVRANETVRIAVPMHGFTGKTVFHCHIAEHEERGMMAVLQVHGANDAIPASLPPVKAPAAPGGHDTHSQHDGASRPGREAPTDGHDAHDPHAGH